MSSGSTVDSRPGSWRVQARRLSRRLIWRARGERVDCPSCGSYALFDLDILPQRNRSVAFVCGCEGCGLVFANPQPSAETLATFYSPSGGWRGGEPDPTERSTKGTAGTWFRAFDSIREELRIDQPPDGARVLDFGCGGGDLLNELQAFGWETWGIEPAEDGAFVRHGRLDAVPSTPTFNLIVAHHVLEHVPRPLELLRQFATAARPGAFLSVRVPRFDTLPVHRDYKYVLNGRAHIIAYTWPCLRTLLARAGWSAVQAPPDCHAAQANPPASRRLRVLARRTDRAEAGVAPAAAAIAATRGYYQREDSRPALERVGFLRLSARRRHNARRRALAAAKTARVENDARA